MSIANNLLYVDHKLGESEALAKTIHNYRQILLYSAGPLLVWTIGLLIFWPGMMTPDSVDQWGQAVQGIYSDAHPAFHTMLISLVIPVWDSPAIIAILQLVFTALVCGWGLLTIAELGVSKSICYLASLILAISPFNIPMVITLWKDIPYSSVFVVLVIVFIRIGFSNGAWLLSKFNLIFLSGVSLLLALLRLNGLAVALGGLLILLYLYKGHRVRIIFCLALFSGLYYFVQGPIYRYFDVDTASWFKLVVPVHHIAAHINSHTPLKAEEIQLLNLMLPLSTGWYYKCNEVTNTLTRPETNFNKSILEANQTEFLKIFYRTFVAHPEVNAKHILCSSSYLWSPFADTNTMALKSYPSINWVYEGARMYGFAANSMIPSLVSPLTNILKKLAFIWKPALFLYFNLLVCFIAVWRLRNKRFLFPLIPILLQTVVLFFISISPDFRYQYGVVLAGYILWPVVLIPGTIWS